MNAAVPTSFSVVARPRSLFTFEFECFDTDEQIIASFRHRAFRSSGEIDVAGTEYSIARQGAGVGVRRAGSEGDEVTMAP